MRVRFQTAQDVALAFPTLADDLAAVPDGTECLAFMKQLLASETPEDSIAFFAYFAPRREAVWWCCRCLAALDEAAEEGPALAAARAWVLDPEEEQRLAALSEAEAGPADAAQTWAAFAAGWSGGNIAPPGNPPVSAAPPLTAKAVRAALLVAVASAPFADRRARLERCVEEALRVAAEEIDALSGEPQRNDARPRT